MSDKVVSSSRQPDPAAVKHVRDTMAEYQQRLDQGRSPEAARQDAIDTMLTRAAREGTLMRSEASVYTGKAIHYYDERRRDLPKDEARAAAVQDVVNPKAAGLDVRNYARGVVDGFQRSYDAGKTDTSLVIASHAHQAKNWGRAELTDAAKVAHASLKQYDAARKQGMDHTRAREHVAREMGTRYDERGRDTQRQERQLSQTMSR